MRKLFLYTLVPVALYVIFFITREQKERETISVHIGKAYEDVIRDSTFPVQAKTAIYPSEPPHPSSTWISSPVVIQYDDPKYGFTLPPTKFGAISYDDGAVSNITTSPMLETVSFNDLASLLEKVQSTLKGAGWIPEDPSNHSWLTTENELQRSALQKKLFKQVVLVMLVAPPKYTLAINVKCYQRCGENNPATAKYLIDISMGRNRFDE